MSPGRPPFRVNLADPNVGDHGTLCLGRDYWYWLASNRRWRSLLFRFHSLSSLAERILGTLNCEQRQVFTFIQSGDRPRLVTTIPQSHRHRLPAVHANLLP